MFAEPEAGLRAQEGAQGKKTPPRPKSRKGSTKFASYAPAGAEPLSRRNSFVCQTTPHFGSTSRRGSYSVGGYCTLFCRTCKGVFVIFLTKFSSGTSACRAHPNPPGAEPPAPHSARCRHRAVHPVSRGTPVSSLPVRLDRQDQKPFRMCSTPHTKGLFLPVLSSHKRDSHQTSSIIAVSAASPRRMPVRVIRV